MIKKRTRRRVWAGGVNLRFVDDVDTNTLVVTGATPAQLRTIDELILLWDVPEPVNKRRTRFSQLVAVRHGSSATIVETVKEAYRDLLSSNDKAFERRGGQGQSGGQEDKPEKSRRGRGSGMASGEEDGGDEDFSFTGKLSLGIDPVGNTILVSAEGRGIVVVGSRHDRATRSSRDAGGRYRGGQIAIVVADGPGRSNAPIASGRGKEITRTANRVTRRRNVRRDPK